MQVAPVKHQIVVNAVLPGQLCHTGVRLKAELRHADFELQRPVRTPLFDGQVRFKVEGVKILLKPFRRVFRRQRPVDTRAAKALEHFMRSGSADIQLLSDFTVGQGVVKPQAECSGDPGATGVRRVSVHGSVHVRESVHGRKHGQKWKTVWMRRLRYP